MPIKISSEEIAISDGEREKNENIISKLAIDILKEMLDEIKRKNYSQELRGTAVTLDYLADFALYKKKNQNVDFD